MQQVIMNLINNSLDAIDGRGGVVEVKTSSKDGFVVLEVADN
jgi:signal transduction histidine kinase